jgi:hypothetical protein
MRKFLLLVFVLMFGFVLTACGGETAEGFPKLDENDLIEMSGTEMVTLLSSIDYTNVDSETVKISVKGNFNVVIENSSEDYMYNWETNQSVLVTNTERNQIDLVIDAVLYTKVSEQVAEAKLFFEGEIDLYVHHEESYYREEHESEQDISGTAKVYFIDQYLYLKPNLTDMIDGVEQTLNFKQKWNMMVTQEMWDDALAQGDVVTDPDQGMGEFLPQ